MPEAVVDGRGAVNGDSNEKMVFGEEFAPVIGQQGPVGLEGVGDIDAGAPETLHAFDGCAVEIQACKGWFATLPAEKVVIHGDGKELRAKPFQQGNRHEVSAVAEELCLARVEAVVAAEVAVAGDRLDEKREGMGHRGISARLPNASCQYGGLGGFLESLESLEYFKHIHWKNGDEDTYYI